jgi:hypothetical protein
MPTNYFIQSSTIGVDLNNGSATALFAVGTHVLGQQGSEWIYVQANTSIVANTMVAFNSGTFTCGMASGGDLITLGSQLATAQTSISSQAFGWVAIRGVGLTVSQTGTTSVQSALCLAASGVPTGFLSAQVSASNTLEGISLLNTVSATMGVYSLSWPRCVAAGGS